MGKLVISTGSGGGVGSDELTASASQVLTGAKYVGADTNDEIGTGSMPVHAAGSTTLNCGGSYTIPAGYHGGTGKVTANSLASQTDATAAAGHILSGQTAWVKGAKITGTIPSQGALSYTPTTGTQTASVSGKYMTGNVTVNPIPTKYKDASGATISNNNQMLSGVKAIGSNGTLYTGNIASMAGTTITPSTSQQTVSCSGKYMTGNVVINAIPSSYVNVTASQTVFSNGVCRLVKRVYPYYVNINTSSASTASTISIGAGTIGSYTGVRGWAGTANVSNISSSTYRFSYILLDGSINVAPYKTLRVGWTYNANVSGGFTEIHIQSYLVSSQDKKGIFYKTIAQYSQSQIFTGYYTGDIDISGYTETAPVYIALQGYAFPGSSSVMRPYLYITNVTLIP